MRTLGVRPARAAMAKLWCLLLNVLPLAAWWAPATTTTTTRPWWVPGAVATCRIPEIPALITVDVNNFRVMKFEGAFDGFLMATMPCEGPPPENDGMLVRYLPEFEQNRRVLRYEEEHDAYEVDAVDDPTGRCRLDFRFSMDIDDRDPSMDLPCGRMIQGEMSNGWLKATRPKVKQGVVCSEALPTWPVCKPNFTNRLQHYIMYMFDTLEQSKAEFRSRTPNEQLQALAVGFGAGALHAWLHNSGGWENMHTLELEPGMYSVAGPLFGYSKPAKAKDEVVEALAALRDLATTRPRFYDVVIFDCNFVGPQTIHSVYNFVTTIFNLNLLRLPTSLAAVLKPPHGIVVLTLGPMSRTDGERLGYWIPLLMSYHPGLPELDVRVEKIPIGSHYILIIRFPECPTGHHGESQLCRPTGSVSARDASEL